MLNVFPALLTFRFLAPTILRIVLGLILIYSGSKALMTKSATETEPTTSPFSRYGAIIELLAGLALALGFYTQVAALVTIVLMICFSIPKFRGNGKSFYSTGTRLLISAVAASLMVSGAGLLAFDLPF